MSCSSSSSNSSAVFVCEKVDMDVKKRKMDDPKENEDGLLIRPCLSMEFNKQEEDEEEHSSSPAAANTTLLYEEELCEEEEVKTPPASPRKRRWECPGAPRKAKAKKRKSWSEEDDDEGIKRMAHSHLCRHLESLFPPAVNKRLKHRPITGL
ncbi:hypothetical protein PIB30_023035 [Stylosanthes scabra]|uniref:Uncharacterized protein n=1 Tax=Stylosanthes scabra TaxID=79078 RepID=A0ABU6W973_9FABA|nr:hypothetical protein [Stylosanthes scabra]